MMTLFREILYRPLFNLTVFLYNIIPGNDFGLSIIVLTVIVKIIFFPLTARTILSQQKLNKLNPQVKEIKEKYKNNTTAQSEAILRLYKENHINPVAGCLPLIIQLPILIALYQAFIAGFKPESLNLLYGFIGNPGTINNTFLGYINIAKSNPVLTILAGALQFLQARQSSRVTQGSGGEMNKEMAALNKQMLYFFPIMIIIIGWNLPAGLLLYWITTTFLSMLEQTYIKYRYK